MPKKKSQKQDEQETRSTKLTDKQRVFVEEYLQSWNATDAARKAGYSGNDNTLGVVGYENLRKPNIREFIEERLSESSMSANEVLKRLSDQARANLLPFVNITNEGFVYFDFSHPEAKNYFHLIKKIKSKRTRKLTGKGENAEMWEDEWVEVELYDAQSALVHLGRHHELFTDKVKGEINENIKVSVYIPENKRDGIS